MCCYRKFGNDKGIALFIKAIAKGSLTLKKAFYYLQHHFMIAKGI